MEYGKYEGVWWSPGHLEHQVIGTLRYDVNGINLDLKGALVVPDDKVHLPHRVETLPVVHGKTVSGQDVTLLRVEGDVAPVDLGDVLQVSYRVSMVVLDVALSSDEFSEVWCHFDCLNAWASPPRLGRLQGDVIEVRAKNLVMGAVQVGDAEVSLVATTPGTVAANSVRIDQSVAFVVRVRASSMKLVSEWVRPLHDMLTVLTGGPVRLVSLQMRPVSESSSGLGTCEVLFDAVQKPLIDDLKSYKLPSSTLLTFRESPTQVSSLIPEWFRLRGQAGHVIALLLASDYAPFMFSEHRYSSVFQSAEALAHWLFRGGELSVERHRARVDRVLEVLTKSDMPLEDVEWVSRRIRSGNSQPLRMLMDRLLNSLGRVGVKILSVEPDFAKKVAGMRVAVSHPTSGSPIGAIKRHWYGEVLRYVVRGSLLLELRIDLPSIEDRICNLPAFQYALNQIGSE